MAKLCAFRKIAQTGRDGESHLCPGGYGSCASRTRPRRIAGSAVINSALAAIVIKVALSGCVKKVVASPFEKTRARFKLSRMGWLRTKPSRSGAGSNPCDRSRAGERTVSSMKRLDQGGD